MHDARMRPDMTTVTTLLTLPPDLAERDRVRRQALRVGSVRHPGLAVLRSADFTSEGLALTWEVPASARTTPPPEDPVALLAPVAAGVALLHDAGLAHGGLSAEAIHMIGGQACVSGWRPGGSPADDVAALATILESWLTSGSVGADVVQVLITGADPDPLVRPSMARVAAVLDRAAHRDAPPVSPPAQRRARVDEASPSRAVGPVAVSVSAVRVGAATSSGVGHARRASGRHAARRGSLALPRIVTWRWGLALSGAAAAALLGFSAMGSAGSAQVMCPASPPSLSGLPASEG